jgi:Holliday junction resolvase
MTEKPPKRISSRAKGKRGELELAAFLEERGYPAKRGQQFKGGGDSPDVICPDLDGIHIECKRVEIGNPYNWLAQAQADALDTGKTPVVMHRKNKQEWLAILTLEDFLNLFLTRGI